MITPNGLDSTGTMGSTHRLIIPIGGPSFNTRQASYLFNSKKSLRVQAIAKYIGSLSEVGPTPHEPLNVCSVVCVGYRPYLTVRSQANSKSECSPLPCSGGAWLAIGWHPSCDWALATPIESTQASTWHQTQKRPPTVQGQQSETKSEPGRQAAP